MRLRLTILTLSTLLLASPLFAITITSVEPPNGTTEGGTTVTIKGDFGSWPYGVLFGSVPAVSTERVDANTIVAVTPPHLPGPSRIVLFEYDMYVWTNATFRFDGPIPASYDRVLLPIFTPVTYGAGGSEFHTQLQMVAKTYSVQLFGLNRVCAPVLCIDNWNPADDAITVTSAGASPDFGYDGNPGRFLFVRDTEVNDLAANLRVWDRSRDAANFGTEMPIVRERDLTQKVVLLGVPTDSRFRNTLRIYGTAAWQVRVTVDGLPPVDLNLRAPTDIFTPAYAEFTDFPKNVGPVRVTIEPTPNMLPVVPPPFWAFITVTNNDTQMITTITPQP